MWSLVEWPFSVELASSFCPTLKIGRNGDGKSLHPLAGHPGSRLKQCGSPRHHGRYALVRLAKAARGPVESLHFRTFCRRIPTKGLSWVAGDGCIAATCGLRCWQDSAGL